MEEALLRSFRIESVMSFIDEISIAGEFGSKEIAATGEFFKKTFDTISDGFQVSDIGDMAENTIDFVSDTGQALWDFGVDTISNAGKHASALWNKITSH